VLKHDEIARIVGPIDDEKIAKILAVLATAEELEEVVAWAKGESDAVGELERPLIGAAARIYDILTSDEALEEE
jgi:hypothetical protein